MQVSILFVEGDEIFDVRVWITVAEQIGCLTRPMIGHRTGAIAACHAGDAADVEGLCQGIDLDLVTLLGMWGQLPLTYAGGVRALEDLHAIEQASSGKMDATVGSALDLFGGKLIKYDDLLAFNARG